MGVVYRAEDLRLDREVAIKFLRKEDNTHAPWLTRFEREARLASALKHPHICTIHELGEEDGRPFIVMELLEGRTMKQRIEEGALPVDQVVHFGVQIAMALDAAHARGIIHRDIKPANMFVTHEDHLKVLDFGLAKLTDRQAAVTTAVTQAAVQTTTDADVTVTGAAVGTAAYMSPEQATGGKVDGRTDLFSFGSVLYEMATGRRAFPGDNTGTVIMRLLKGRVHPAAIAESGDSRAPRDHHPARDGGGPEPALPDRRRNARGSAVALACARAGCLVDRARQPIAPAAMPARRDARVRGWVIGVAGIVLIARGRRLALDPTGPAMELTEQGQHPGRWLRQHDRRCRYSTRRSAMALKVQLGQSPFLDIVADDRVTDELKTHAASERGAADARRRRANVRAARPEGDARRHACGAGHELRAHTQRDRLP